MCWYLSLLYGDYFCYEIKTSYTIFFIIYLNILKSKSNGRISKTTREKESECISM